MVTASAGWRWREVHHCWYLMSARSGEKKETQMTEVRGTVITIHPARRNPGLLHFLWLTSLYWLCFQYWTWYFCFMKLYWKVCFFHLSSYSWSSVAFTDTFVGGKTLTVTQKRSQNTNQHLDPALPFTIVSSMQRLKTRLCRGMQ